MPRREAYYRPTRARILRARAQQIERWAARIRGPSLLLYGIYWGWWAVWSIRGESPVASPLSLLPTWALHIPHFGSLVLTLGIWLLLPGATREITRVLREGADRLSLDHETRHGVGSTRTSSPAESESRPQEARGAPTPGRRRPALVTGMGVGAILPVALSVPALLVATSPDGTLTAAASSPGFLPGCVGVLVDGGVHHGRADVLMPRLRCRVDLRDNHTREIINLLDIQESSDFAEDWREVSDLKWSRTGNVLRSTWGPGLGPPTVTRFRIRRNPLQFEKEAEWLSRSVHSRFRRDDGPAT